nr:MAG TPA: hypothetical protein [Caudoviricetes sp.]
MNLRIKALTKVQIRAILKSEKTRHFQLKRRLCV